MYIIFLLYSFNTSFYLCLLSLPITLPIYRIYYIIFSLVISGCIRVNGVYAKHFPYATCLVKKYQLVKRKKEKKRKEYIPGSGTVEGNKQIVVTI